MKTILVTGGAGFIGSNFVSHIFKKYKDYRIIVLDALTYAGNLENILLDIRNSDRFEFWYGDANNLDLVSDLVRADVVVHLQQRPMLPAPLSQQGLFVTMFWGRSLLQCGSKAY